MTKKRLIVCAVAVLALASFAVCAADAKPAGTETKAPAKKPVIDLKTSVGTITVELWPDVAQQTVRNFTDYVVEGHYDGTIFHRVIKTFMIQGGSLTKDGTAKPTRPPIPLEAREHNGPYTIAMARTDDPNSATDQFFINVGNNTRLDPTSHPPGYTVFGKVIKGKAVVDQIARAPVHSAPNGEPSVPDAPVVIEKATLAN